MAACCDAMSPPSERKRVVAYDENGIVPAKIWRSRPTNTQPPRFVLWVIRLDHSCET